MLSCWECNSGFSLMKKFKLKSWRNGTDKIIIRNPKIVFSVKYEYDSSSLGLWSSGSLLFGFVSNPACQSWLACTFAIVSNFPSSEHLSFVTEGVSLSLWLGQKCLAIRSTRITDFSSRLLFTHDLKNICENLGILEHFFNTKENTTYLEVFPFVENFVPIRSN